MEASLSRVPPFFERARRIRLRDPLADFLGAAEAGVIEYSYLDAVKLAGHSCPTVAGAYLATLEALQTLYPAELPERGGVRVELRGNAEEGTVGVVASVVGLITGAAAGGGFKGIGGRFARHGLLMFSAPILRELRLTRVDNGASVALDLPRPGPLPEETRRALARALSPEATPAERAGFSQAWQARVEKMFGV